MFQTKIFEMYFCFLLYIWVQVDCRPTSQQIYKRTSSNLIRKRTGCDEYVEDQLNVASKNFAKYLFDDTDGKRYLEDICSRGKIIIFRSKMNKKCLILRISKMSIDTGNSIVP